MRSGREAQGWPQAGAATMSLQVGFTIILMPSYLANSLSPLHRKFVRREGADYLIIIRATESSSLLITLSRCSSTDGSAWPEAGEGGLGEPVDVWDVWWYGIRCGSVVVQARHKVSCLADLYGLAKYTHTLSPCTSLQTAAMAEAKKRLEEGEGVWKYVPSPNSGHPKGV